MSLMLKIYYYIVSVYTSHVIKDIGLHFYLKKIEKKLKEKYTYISNEKVEEILLYFKAFYNIDINPFMNIVPFINVLYVLVKAIGFNFNKAKMNSHIESVSYMVNENFEEECEAVDNDREYFVRFTKNNKFNTIFFRKIDNGLEITETNGTVGELSEDEQLLMLSKILNDLQKGIDLDYGYSYDIDDIIGRFEIHEEIFVPEVETEEKEMVRERKK